MADKGSFIETLPREGVVTFPTIVREKEHRPNGEEFTRAGFNRYLYENLLCHVEGQIECWNRKAVREPSPEAARVLWLKAEGLGYALRLLYAFEPEFRELTDSAKRCTANESA
jgi:hypothetical protein